MLGLTAQLSKANVVTWMNGHVAAAAGPACIVNYWNGLPSIGVYHHLLKDQYEILVTRVTAATNAWAIQCSVLGRTLGKWYVVRSGGKGCATITNSIVGPFR